ncbi:tetratricopeptide repeat protein [Acidiphilium sp.]|uniref:tetratricopeptide repeat-containing glycosyltransferase family protein n=1 Tax=Acidiphilium sp. TaxID=527 RepID=UPI003D02CC36
MSATKAQLLFETGNAHDAAGAYDAAVAAFAACAALAPDHVAAQINLGNALIKAERIDEAIDAYRRCLTLAPNLVDVMFALGNALSTANRLPEAVETYITCLRHAPDFGAVYVNLAGALRRLGVLDHATIMAETAVRLMPGDVDALACLAGLHYDQGDFEAAVVGYGHALAAAPSHAGVLSSLANALHSAGRLDAALALHERAYATAPNNADYRYNRALSLLAAGDYERGWVEHEWRHRRSRAARLAIERGPAWTGEPIAGRTILLHAEQGFGDTLQFVRYAPLVAALGARVILQVPEPLVRLMRSVPSVAEVVGNNDPAPRFETHCALMSLPLRFGTTVATIPAPIPYLSVAPAAVARWRGWFADDERRRVGLVWAGGTHHGDIDSHLIDRRRSLPITALAPLAAVDRVQFVCLQRDAATLPRQLDLIDPMPLVADFADTAALIASLDLVIAVDTAVAHLAGALGKPVWLLSRYDGCWRWFERRSDTPWYPTMRIFRQARPQDWDGVIRHIVGALNQGMGTDQRHLAVA